MYAYSLLIYTQQKSTYSKDYGLGQAVTGCIKCIACCFAGRLRYRKESVQYVIGIGGSASCVFFGQHVVRGIVGITIGIDDGSVGFGIGECVEKIVDCIGIVFPGSVAVHDTLHAAVVVKVVDGGQPIGYDLADSSDTVIDLLGDIAFGIGCCLCRTSGIHTGGVAFSHPKWIKDTNGDQ